MIECSVECERPSGGQLAWFFQGGLEPGVALPEQVRHVVTEHQAVGYVAQRAERRLELHESRGSSSSPGSSRT
jgi:hypothetical protein